MQNAVRDSYYVVLTDDETLAFDDVVRSLVSSSMAENKSISPYKLVIIGVV
jgi:hypothetical protein